MKFEVNIIEPRHTDAIPKQPVDVELTDARIELFDTAKGTAKRLVGTVKSDARPLALEQGKRIRTSRITEVFGGSRYQTVSGTLYKVEFAT